MHWSGTRPTHAIEAHNRQLNNPVDQHVYTEEGEVDDSSLIASGQEGARARNSLSACSNSVFGRSFHPDCVHFDPALGNACKYVITNKARVLSIGRTAVCAHLCTDCHVEYTGRAPQRLPSWWHGWRPVRGGA